jgi:hypothetical protein
LLGATTDFQQRILQIIPVFLGCRASLQSVRRQRHVCWTPWISIWISLPKSVLWNSLTAPRAGGVECHGQVRRQPGAAGRGRLCSGSAAARCQQVGRGFHIALMSSMVTIGQAAADDWSVLGAVVGAKALHWHTLAHYFDMTRFCVLSKSCLCCAVRMQRMQQRVAVMTGEILLEVYRAFHTSVPRWQIWCRTTRSTFGGREPNLASIAASDDDSEYSTEKQEFMGTSSSSSG